jgi:glycosyltransferase involved in cell wall biosynthesis
MRPLRVAVDARFVPGTVGGVETVILGLAQGFAAIPVGDVSVTFVTYRGLNDWIGPHLGRAVRSIEVPPLGRAARMLRKGRIWAVRPHGRSFGVLPGRDRVLAGLEADLLHFPLQRGSRVSQPFIYHPHDLQHRHLPDFFTRRQIASREVVFRSLCGRATAIAVGSSWVKQDLIRQMRIDPAKIFVVPLAPVVAADTNDQAVDVERLRLPKDFVIYPAASWPHKNHQRLIAAIALLRGRGIEVPLVLTGPRPIGVDLVALVEAYGVGDLVFDLGYRPQSEVEELTRRAVAMAMPTLFEAASFPVWEAFRLGTPVACSNVTSLPRQVDGSAVLFDPLRADSIASAIESLWRDPLRREELARLGSKRVDAFSWERTARHFLALYHRVGGRAVSNADRQLLDTDPFL